MICVFLFLSIKLSEYCQNPSLYQNPINITSFDIPFCECEIDDFSGKQFSTTYSTIRDYKHRTIRLDGQISLSVNDVISGDILNVIDIIDATLTLNLAPYVSTIYGDIRVNKELGSKLIVNGGSFHAHPQKLLRFIHTNDVHCAFEEGNGVIGLPKLASYIKYEKQQGKEKGYSVLAVDCGDFIQGQAFCNLNKGVNGRNALGVVNYDAFTIGNHEWDFGHQSMYEYWTYFDERNAPLVVSNINDSSSEENIVFNPYLVKMVDGIRVGIFGLITPFTNVTTNPAEVRNVHFDADIVSVSKKYTDILRNQERCDVIICLSHLGYEQLAINSNFLAENFDGIDAIIDGHSHTTLSNGAFRINNDRETIIAQTGSGLNNIGCLDILLDGENKQVISKSARLLSYNDITQLSIPNDKDTENFLNEANVEIKKITSEIIGETLIDLDCERASIRTYGISKMADLVTTAMLITATDAVVAIENGGGVRAPISAGNVTYGDAITVLPFGNQVLTINMTGSQLKYLIQYGTRFYGIQENGGFPTTSGLTYTLNLNENWDSENRITDMKIVDINGSDPQPVYDDKYYGVALTNFLYEGGDGYESITGLPKLSQYDTELNSVIEYFKNAPSNTITGEEALFAYKRINTVGTVQTSRKKSYSYRRHVVPRNDGENVQIEGYLNIVDLKVNDDIFSNHFNFTIKSSSIIASDRQAIAALSPTQYSYVGEEGLIIAGNSSSFIYGDDLNSSSKLTDLISCTPSTPSTDSNECIGIFKFNDGGECKTNTGFIVVIVIMGVFIILSIILLLVLVKLRHTNNGSKEDNLLDEV